MAKAKVVKLGAIIPAHDPAMLRLSGKELKDLASGRSGRSAAAKRAADEIARRKANKATKKANAALLAK